MHKRASLFPLPSCEKKKLPLKFDISKIDAASNRKLAIETGYLISRRYVSFHC